MPLEYIEHYLVQTADMEKTVRWYEEVLQLQKGRTPDFGFPVQWMYIGDRDVLHITHGGVKSSANRKTYLGQQSDVLQGSGVIDHVGFRASGLAELRDRLTSMGVQFKERQVNDQGLYQIFLFDPNDVKVELNFPVEEATAAGITAPVSAATFQYQHVADDK
jgi:catechol 2,3-dioxygenase-like lactoylglutathione lyase family enzyme